MIHETVGSLSLRASYSNWPSGRCVRPLTAERRVGRRVLEVREVLQHVAAVGVALLVHLPADARRLQPLGVRRPGVTAGRGLVVEDRAAVLAVGVDRAGHPHHPVGPGRAEHRAVVAVADGERLGQRELERQVGARVVTHDVRAVLAVGLAVRRQPVVHLAAVPGVVLDLPGVRRRRDLLRVGRVRVQVERQHVAGRVLGVGLVEDGPAVGQLRGVRVTEPANAGQGAEVVVEGPVLLHEQHDVLDVLQRTVPGRALGEGPLDVRRHEGGGSGGGGGAGGPTQETATSQFGHAQHDHARASPEEVASRERGRNTR